ncbi:MAG TPA: glycosyltransferase family 1 protein [Ignavibacteriaceae bacterium]|nr:glycosyltransferase family 1 protein [Ignavibacteriaceae bacterium]
MKKKITYFSLKKMDFIPHKLLSFIWVQIIFPIILYKHNPRVVIYPNNISSFFLKSKSKKILILYDLFHKINKEYHDPVYNKYLEFNLKTALDTNDLIICISQSTKNDLIKYYEPNINKIAVLYSYGDKKFHPIKTELREFDSIKNKFGIVSPFLLYVGKLETRKNVVGILEIARILQIKGVNLQTVLVGTPGYGFDKIQKKISESTSDIIHLTNISDSDLNHLYNMAGVFIFPSLYEGFGYPVLEAMQSGCPVVVSNCPALTEIVGERGIKIEPTDFNKFSEVIVRLLTDKKYRTDLIEYGITQSKNFSAERMRNEFKGLLKNLL